jgi:integrase
MARKLQKLTARGVASQKKSGRHSDGGGLYLVVDENGSKRWVFLFRWEGRQPEMGLGPLSAVPLARARELAAECRALLASGISPLEARKSERAAPASTTFGTFATSFIELNEPGWRNAKHRQQWKNTLRDHAKPLRSKRLDGITTEDVLAVLTPIWQVRPETASRLRGRIERILDAAKVSGLRSGENPARWRGHLQALLPKPKKLSRGHHRALAYSEVPAFMARLRERPAIAARALEFLILTAARSGEVLNARWEEVDIETKLWRVPPSRMKGGREHRVPLSDRALAILEEVKQLGSGEHFIFPGQRPRRPLSGMALEMLLRRFGITEATPHGFRSSFRDWAGNETSAPREVAEAVLAHAIGDRTEQSYRRSDALAKRRKLMDAWARHCVPHDASGEVLPFLGRAL